MKKLSMDELNRLSVEEFKEAKKNKVIAVLDNVRSMHNVGSVFRTADSFLITAVMLCGYTPQPPHRDIHKTALGATETVDWMYFENTVDAVTALKQNGYKVYGIEQVDTSEKLDGHTFSGDEQIAVVFGNEVHGVAHEVLEICDGIVEIPQEGTKHSLNISIAAGIVLWEAFKQLKKPEFKVLPAR